jgi:hypothetical protein
LPITRDRGTARDALLDRLRLARSGGVLKLGLRELQLLAKLSVNLFSDPNLIHSGWTLCEGERFD